MSCSECSYDSEACTCTSADRCYCSLGADHDVAAKLEATKKKQQQRHSMYSCGSTEDKCYCSMTEGTQSQTTCCDSDSCISTSKCYCQSGGPKAHSHHASHRSSHSDNNNNYANSEHDLKQQNKSCKKDKKKSKDSKSRRDNLGLDYELFTVSAGTKAAKNAGTTGKSVQAAEALSAKKSVEAAAIFADVKLSQTTDISTMVSSSGGESPQRRSGGGDKMNNLNGEEKRGHRESAYGITKSDMSVMAREKGLMKIRIGGGKPESIYGSTNGRPVSASGLEDSLGYLP